MVSIEPQQEEMVNQEKGHSKLSVREDVLTRLKEVQAGLGEEIVSPAEEKLIREVWHNDSID